MPETIPEKKTHKKSFSQGFDQLPEFLRSISVQNREINKPATQRPLERLQTNGNQEYVQKDASPFPIHALDQPKNTHNASIKKTKIHEPPAFLALLLKKKKDNKEDKEKTNTTPRPFLHSQSNEKSLATQLKKILGNKQVIVMNRLSFLGLTAGVTLTSGLFFTAGFLTAMSLKIGHAGGESTLTSLQSLVQQTKNHSTPSQELSQTQESPMNMEDMDILLGDDMPPQQQETPAKNVDPKSFSISIETFTDLQLAKKKSAELKAKNYRPYIVKKIDNNGKTYCYSLRLGFFNSFLNGRKMRDILKAQGYHNAEVMSIQQGEIPLEL